MFPPHTYTPAKSIAVSKEMEEFFEENPALRRKLEEFGFAYQTTGWIIPQHNVNLFSGHFFPFMDSWEEFQVSATHLCMGLYKQAFVFLRIGLELGLLSVYFNINDDGHNAVKNWFNSKNSSDANTPNEREIWRILLRNENINKFNAKHNLKTEFGYFA